MRAVIAFVAAGGATAMTGVSAKTAAECSDLWTAECENHPDYFVDPKIQLLPECISNEDCIENGLTACGAGTTDANGNIKEVWLTANGELQEGIVNRLYKSDGSEAPDNEATCGTDAQQVSWLDAPTPNADGTITAASFTGCYAPGNGEQALSGMPANYPTSRPANVPSCRQGNEGKPKCRCRATPRGTGKSDCRALSDAAQTSSVLAARFRAFKEVHQCEHFEAATCSSKDMCRFAGPNLKKQCESHNPCTTNFACTTVTTAGDTAGTCTYDSTNGADLTPGSASERCSCNANQCEQNWQDWEAKQKAYTDLLAGDKDAVNANTKQAKNEFDQIEKEMARLESAGQCLGLRPGSNPTTTPKPDYTMHIGIIAAIAAASVFTAAIITGALICILMYACRSESHVETQARNQAVMNPYGPATVYGRGGHEMEMTRRSRY